MAEVYTTYEKIDGGISETYETVDYNAPETIPLTDRIMALEEAMLAMMEGL